MHSVVLAPVDGSRQGLEAAEEVTRCSWAV